MMRASTTAWTNAATPMRPKVTAIEPEPSGLSSGDRPIAFHQMG